MNCFFYRRSGVLALGLLLSLHGAILLAGVPSEMTHKSGLQPESALTAVFAPGAETVWRWVLEKKELMPKDGGAVEWELEYWNGEKECGKLEIPASAELLFKVKPKLRGWAILRTALKARSGQTIATDETTLVMGEAPTRGGRSFRYGIVGGLRSDGEDYTRSIELMDKLGVDIVRGDFEWGLIEPSRGEWRFDRHDRFVADLKSRGMEAEGILCYTTQWASTGDRNAKNWLTWARAMPEMGAWLEYVKKTVSRYKGSVRYWEIWNEPDISFWQDTTENYIRLFNETAKAIREIDPTAVVINGGLAFAPGERNPKFREDFVAGAEKKNWNIRAYHDYHTFQQMTARYAEQQALYQGSPLVALPAWINEGGFHTLLRGGDRQQAIHLVKKIAAAPSFPGASAYIWYNLNDIKPEGNDPENRFGVANFYFRPKPAYGAYQELIHELAPRKYLARPEGATTLKGVWMQLYAGKHDHRLVLWQEGAKGLAPVALKWEPSKTQVVAATDLMGNPIPVSRLRGQTIVTISDAPIYVSLQGAAEYPVMERVVEGPDTLALLPSAKPEMRLSIRNPTAEPWPVELSVRFENGAETPVVTQAVISANESKLVTVGLPVFTNQTASEGRLKVEMQSTGNGALHVLIPYEKANVVPRANEKSGVNYRFELNKPTQVMNLFDAQGRSDQAWRGAEDLSAQGELSYDDRGLNIRLVTTDDRHSQAENGPLIWRGDSVQLALRVEAPGATPLEMSVALANAGETLAWIQAAPEGSRFPVGGVDTTIFPYKVVSLGKQTTYTLTIPWIVLGRQSPPVEGFRFNFLVNDNDGDGRRQWIELAPGIGNQKDTTLFPLFICN